MTETPTISETPTVTETIEPPVTPIPTEAVPVRLWANAHPSVLVVTENEADTGTIEVKLLGSGGESLPMNLSGEQGDELKASLINDEGKEIMDGPRYAGDSKMVYTPWFLFFPDKNKPGIVRIRIEFRRPAGDKFSLSAEAQFTVRRESQGLDKLKEVTNPEGTVSSDALLRRSVKSTKYKETLE
jgi:hypothetical protein